MHEKGGVLTADAVRIPFAGLTGVVDPYAFVPVVQSLFAAAGFPAYRDDDLVVLVGLVEFGVFIHCRIVI